MLVVLGLVEAELSCAAPGLLESISSSVMSSVD